MPLYASNFTANSLSGTVRVSAGSANIRLVVAPFAFEGNKQFVLKLRKNSFDGPVLISSSNVLITDISSIVSVSANVSTVAEGNLVAFTITTANVPNNSNVYFSILPVTSNITSSDFVSNTGIFTIVNNTATFALRASSDLSVIDETGETFKLQVRTNAPDGNIVYTTSNIAILDVSKAYNVLRFGPPSFTLVESSNVTFTFSATNVPSGTTLYYETTGNALVTANTGSFVLNGLSNTFTVVAGAVPDSSVRAFAVNLRSVSNTGPIEATSNNVYVIDGALAYLNATGGNEVYTINGYRVHKFLSSNNFTITRSAATAALGNVEVLMVAGGGGGGSGPYGYFGGGGAGGLLYYGTETPKTQNGFPLVVNANDTYAVTVGAGGARSSPGTNSNISLNSNVFLNAIGGGNGSYGGSFTAGAGGSGGGGSQPSAPDFGAGTAGQGNPGGPEFGRNGGGGGGGAGSAGTYYQGGSQTGGSGLAYSISGASTIYAGGGGGGGSGPAGPGGGGNTNVPGTTNTGGGGGGGTPSSNPGTGGTGGSGIVIIRYQYVEPPTYTSLIPISSSANAGSNVRFTLNTLNLANNSLLYYSTVGNVISSDFVSGNTGSFRTTANTTTIALRSNTNFPATETRFFQLQVRADSLTDPVVATSNVVTLYTALPPGPNIEILLVAGGGGAGSSGNWSAGGGAGGLLYYGANTTPKTPNGNLIFTLSSTLYTVTLGAGGATNVNGSNTFISNPDGGIVGGTAVGGGKGGSGAFSPVLAGNGGSGGGGSQNSAPGSTIIGAFPGGSGISGQGFAGGNGFSPSPTGGVGTGGGGGASAVGTNGGLGTAGNGGAGIGYNLVGSMTFYGGGGAGQSFTPPSGPSFIGSGGVGGGGGQSTGGINTGGGGGIVTAGSGSGYAGGSGIAIVRYPDTFANATTTGSPNLIISSGFRTYRFWQSGSITF